MNFSNCTKLKTLTLPASLTSIDADAFGFETIVTTVNFCGTEEQWKALGYTFDESVTINYNYVPTT